MQKEDRAMSVNFKIHIQDHKSKLVFHGPEIEREWLNPSFCSLFHIELQNKTKEGWPSAEREITFLFSRLETQECVDS